MASPPSTSPFSLKSSWTKTKVSTDQGFLGRRVLGEGAGGQRREVAAGGIYLSKPRCPRPAPPSPGAGAWGWRQSSGRRPGRGTQLGHRPGRGKGGRAKALIRLPHAAAREAELRRLRKMNVAFEEQNAVLQRHTQSMSSARERLEQELALEERRTLALQQQLQAVRQALTASFASLPVPGAEAPPRPRPLSSEPRPAGSTPSCCEPGAPPPAVRLPAASDPSPPRALRPPALPPTRSSPAFYALA